ncbi:MAG: methionine--tRNA ligase [Candidatus Sungbacteria bacterium]|nr:methionine--tRNA ligase [Candidatus Sungbacteria bacterium]
MNKKPYFITTPIYYVNDVPHIGHAYTTVAADVYARWRKSMGQDVRLLTGTDEHGDKIEKAATARGKDVKSYADEISSVFRETWDKLCVQYDRFIRTTDSDHGATVKQFMQKIYDRGFVSKGIYEGLYCVGHEAFLNESDLVDNKCPDHQTIPERHKEENYFFHLSKFQDQLIKLIESDELVIAPDERKNEILGKLRQGLEDISISRSMKKTKWGIPIPRDETQTVYVWVDALINYYTYGSQEKCWPADLHLVGKDILWFHSVVWPALLLAAGEEPPKKVFAHGFFTIGGQKMSKTLGNVITPDEITQKFGVDGARYLLLSAFPFGADGDFDWDKLTEKYNADLANGIGNLAARITTLAAEQEINLLGLSGESQKYIDSLAQEYQNLMESLEFYGAINIIQQLVSYADQLKDHVDRTPGCA